MNIGEIEELVGIIQTSRISELTVTTGTDKQTTVRLRKALSIPAPVAPVQRISVAQSEPAAMLVSPEVVVKAPMVGIFHSLDSVGIVGTNIKIGQVVGSIESMKLMNDVVSKHEGVIAEVMVEDGMPVEYGHSLFRLEKI